MSTHHREPANGQLPIPTTTVVCLKGTCVWGSLVRACWHGVTEGAISPGRKLWFSNSFNAQ